jgi:hypothetical protein
MDSSFPTDPLDVPDSPELPSDPGLPAPRPRPAIVEQFIGTVRSHPCTGSSADYTDARYSIDRAAPKAASSISSALSAQSESIAGLKQCLTATNLAELSTGSHLLSPGTLVHVFALYSRGRGGGRVYVFNHPAVDGAVVQITGNETGAGEYAGQILAGSSSASPGSNLSMPAGLSPSAGALVINTEETGVSGHRLSAGAYAVGVIRGMTSETTPRSIVVIRGAMGRLDSPKGLGGGGVTPNTTPWSRASDAMPLSLTVVTAVAWDSGAAALLANSRTLIFDARGLLSSVSAESQSTINSTTACTTP